MRANVVVVADGRSNRSSGARLLRAIAVLTSLKTGKWDLMNESAISRNHKKFITESEKRDYSDRGKMCWEPRIDVLS